MAERLHKGSSWIWVVGTSLRQRSQKCIPFDLYIYPVTQKSWELKKKENQIHNVKRSKARGIKGPHYTDSHESHYRRPTLQHSKTHTAQLLSGIPFTDYDHVSEKNKHKNDFWEQSPAESISLNGLDIYILSLTRDFALNFQRFSCAGEICCILHNLKTLWADSLALVLGPTQPPNSVGTVGSFPRWESGQRLRLTTHFHVVQRLRTSTALPPFPLHLFIYFQLTHCNLQGLLCDLG